MGMSKSRSAISIYFLFEMVIFGTFISMNCMDRGTQWDKH